jgi:[ribosomal protein S18]-alanine N-acetyltransferase
MDIQIEYATIRILEELYEIEKLSFREEAFSKKQIGYLLDDYNSVSLVARIDGKLVGFIIGSIESSDNQLGGHILTIDVAPAYRRMKVAERLMLDIEGIFKGKGIGEIQLEVREGNDAALSLYRKLGYSPIAKLTNYYGSAHGLYLRKKI